MTTDRRLDSIRHLAIRREIEVEELSGLLRVSPSVVRRKLRAPIHYDPPYANRAAKQLDEKRVIALAATRLITLGMVLVMTGDTICTELTRLVLYVDDLTIVTNVVNIALELRGQSNKRVIVTGGTANSNSYELVGSQAIGSLENVHCEMGFLGASGVSVGYALSMSDELESVVGRAHIASVECAVVLADYTKPGKRGLARVCPLNRVHLLITDDQAEPEQVRPRARAGLEMIIAEQPSADAGKHRKDAVHFRIGVPGRQ